MKSIHRKLKKIEETMLITDEQHIDIDQENCTIVVRDPYKDEADWFPYAPSKTGLAFHKDNSFVRVIKGPYGSGKSTGCCAEIVLRACAMFPCKDGVRRSRWAIVRNTYGDLEATTYQTWLSWFGALGAVRTKRAPRFWVLHRFNDGKGEIELELLFIALDRPDQIAKLKSLELTGAYLNEIDGIPKAALTHFIGRVNKRFPAKKDCDEDYWSGIIADANPPDIDHWIYKLFEVIKPLHYVMFSQPPALIKTSNGYDPNPEAENIEHLGAGYNYYLEMTHGQTEEFIKVYVLGQYGTAVDGRRVYDNYNDDIHSVESIKFDQNVSIMMTVDPGFICPAILLSQYVEGQLRAIKEFIGECTTVKEMVNEIVKPYLYKNCKGMSIDIVRDPADTNDCEKQLLECELPSDIAKTNQVETRIRAQRDFLNILIRGKPGYIVSREGCPVLRKGFIGHYMFKRLRIIGEEKYKDVPDKGHPYSDIHDCQQYAALEFHPESFAIPEEEREIDERFLIRSDDRNDVTGY